MLPHCISLRFLACPRIINSLQVRKSYSSSKSITTNHKITARFIFVAVNITFAIHNNDFYFIIQDQSLCSADYCFIGDFFFLLWMDLFILPFYGSLKIIINMISTPFQNIFYILLKFCMDSLPYTRMEKTVANFSTRGQSLSSNGQMPYYYTLGGICKFF